MRHRILGKKLNRDSKHRKALFKNLIKGLIANEEIKTTESKAKVIKRILDKLINRGKKGTFQARRIIASFLQDKKAVNKLVDDIAPRYKDKVGGFTRIIKSGERRGDNSMMVKIELTQKDINKKEQVKTNEIEKDKQKTDKKNKKASK